MDLHVFPIPTPLPPPSPPDPSGSSQSLDHLNLGNHHILLVVFLMLMTTHAGKGSMLNHLGLSETWNAAHQAPLPMGFLRQDYWNGLPLPPRGNLPNPGIKPQSPATPALAGAFFTTEPPESFPSNTVVLTNK